MKKISAYKIGFVVLTLLIGSIYLSLQALTIYGGDAGDLVSAIVTKGIPHPPGYPLYTSLGVLISRLVSIGTPAYKAGFLSVIPAVLTLIILYDLFYFLTNRAWISFITALTLGFVYPFWLYSEVVEVFSLNNLFMGLLIWALLRFVSKPKNKYLFLFAFSFGLSLSHHHIILFLIPGLFYLLWTKRGHIQRTVLFKSAVLILAGITPYLYAVVSSSFNPAMNWQGPPTLLNIFQLITRAGYGTFRVGSFTAHQPILRLLDLFVFFNFVYNDFRILGLILFVLGAFYLFKNKRAIFYSLTISLVSYLFFIFYASYPLFENFLIGTFERFVQPLYILIIFFILFGFLELQFIIDFLLSKFLPQSKRNKLLVVFSLLFFIYPAGMFYLNFWKISIIRNDFTAEKLGEDILKSIPGKSILILSNDTPLFNTQYVYYTQNKWPDRKIIHLSKIFTSYYYMQLKKYYPDLWYPDPGSKDSPHDMFQAFINHNYEKYPIYSKVSFDLDDGIWIPWGVLYRYYKKDNLPKDEEVKKENDRLFKDFNDPLSASLKIFRNMMLADTLRTYAIPHQEYGVWLAKRGLNEEARGHILEAERLYPEDLDSYTYLAQVYIRLKLCDEAQKQIDYRIMKDPEESSSYLLTIYNYALCYKDQDKANYYRKLYEDKLHGKETQLKQL